MELQDSIRNARIRYKVRLEPKRRKRSQSQARRLDSKRDAAYDGDDTDGSGMNSNFVTPRNSSNNSNLAATGGGGGDSGGGYTSVSGISDTDGGDETEDEVRSLCECFIR